MRQPDGCVVTLRNVTRGDPAEHGSSSTVTVVAKLQVLRVALLDSPVCLLRFRSATASETDSSAPQRIVAARGGGGAAGSYGEESSDVAGSVSSSGGRDDDDSTAGAHEGGDSDDGSVGSSTPLVPSSARKGGDGKKKKPSSSSLAAAASTDIVGCPMSGKPPTIGSKHVRFASSDRGMPLTSYKGTPRAWPGAARSSGEDSADAAAHAPSSTSHDRNEASVSSRSGQHLHPPPRISAPVTAIETSDGHASPPPAVIVSARSPLAPATKVPDSSAPGAPRDGMKRAGSLRHLGRRNSAGDVGAGGSVAHSSVGSSRATSRAQNMRSSIAAHANKLEETLVTLKRTIGIVFCLAAFLSIASLVTAQLLFGQVRQE